MNKPPLEGYILIIRQMILRARDWLERNPGAAVSVQFNFPREVFLIATFYDAQKRGLVSLNEDAKKLVGFMAPGTDATVNQVRAALELVYKKEAR